MRTVYRVTVAAVNYDDEGNFVGDETLFEATHHRAGALLRFAPTEVDDALRVIAGDPARSEPLPAMPVPAATWDRAAEPQAVDEPAVEAQTDAPAAGTKRKRRTKAEIEADKAAEALAAQQAESAAPEPDGPEPQAAEPATGTQPAAPVVVPEPVPAEGGTAPASTPLTPSGDGQPWNPFLQR